MTLRKDVTATALTILAVLVYAAAHEGWGVPLVGTSHRWAAGAILLLGIGTCGQGRATKGVATLVLSALGVAALGLGVAALWTGSLTPLSLLVAAVVCLWAASTVRHAAARGAHGPAIAPR
jgi:hypothetical protein